jgi:hypothetical protein
MQGLAAAGHQVGGDRASSHPSDQHRPQPGVVIGDQHSHELTMTPAGHREQAPWTKIILAGDEDPT